MLSFFRRFVSSRVGVIVTFGVLAVIALAFAASDITGLASGSGGLLGNPLAKVAGESVTAADIRKRAQDELRAAQQRDPSATMAQLVAAGGVEALVERWSNGLALEAFGRSQGMRVSRALVGSEIQAIPAFRGPTGQFDQRTYEALIGQRGLTDAQVQREIARESMAQFLIVPTIGARQVSMTLALPYASLLLERREGAVGFVPNTAAGAVPAPSDAQVQDWYKRNVARYTVPEQRILRYARVTPEAIAGQTTPTDAELQAAYAAARDTYAAKELRSVSLVTVLDQNAASALAAKVRGGTRLAEAARAAGLEARTIAAADRQALTQQTAAAVANAVFGAAEGATVGPVRGTIGFVVAKVDAITQRAGRPFAAVRGELVAQVSKRKAGEAMQRIRDAVDDALADNANINEVAADQKLKVEATPPMLANATRYNVPQAPDPALAPIVAAGFAAEEGDTPATVPLGPDGSFAVVALDRVLRPAPVPLAQARTRVAADLTADRQRQAARTLAARVLAAANKGTPLAAAMAQAGRPLPAPEPVSTTRADLAADRRGPAPVLQLMFGMKQGTARLQASPDGRGWLIVKLDRIIPGDAGKRPEVIAATRQDLGRVLGAEYMQQFTRAVAARVGTSRDRGAIDQLKRELLGGDANGGQANR
jgi:peptidyl-prolyl cis-trans isomerase D